MRFSVFPLLLAATLAAASCSDDTTTTAPTTTTPTTTETFSDTVTVNGAKTHQFAVTTRGSVSATLKSLSPDADQTVGVSLGTWNGLTCQIILANDSTVVGSGVNGAVSGVGNLCLRVYDVGKLKVAESYSVDVTHP
jgi:hypothetical protein